MKCVLSKEQHLQFFKKIASDLLDKAKSQESFATQEYIKDMYKMISSKTSDNELALAYVTLMPKYLAVAAGVGIDELGDTIGNNFAEFNRLKKSFEADIQNVVNYITDTPVQEELVKKANRVTPSTGTNITPANEEEIINSIAKDNSAIPITMLAPTGQDSEVDAKGNYTNVIKHDMERTILVRTNMISEMAAKGITNGDDLVYSNQKGFKLRLVKETQLPSNINNLRRVANENFMVQAITDMDGNFLAFDKDGKITTADKGETIHFTFRKMEGKTLDNYDKMVKESLTRSRKELESRGIASADITQYLNQEKTRLEKLKQEEIVKYDQLKKDFTSNPEGVHLQNITGGTTGYLPEPLGQEWPVTSSVNITDADLKGISYNLSQGKTTVKINKLNKNVIIQAYALNQSALTDRVDQITKVLNTPSSRILTDQNKIDYLGNFLLLNNGKNKSNVYFDTKSGQLVLKVKNTTVDLNNIEAIKNALTTNGLFFAINKSKLATNYTEYNITDGKVTPMQKPWLNLLKDYTKLNLVTNSNNDIVQLNGYFTYDYSPKVTPEIQKEEIKKAEDLNTKSITDDEFDYGDIKISKLIELNTSDADRVRAENWWNNSTISKVKINGKTLVPLERLQHVTNSNAFATWGLSGIKLYSGSDDTHLYHEAYHAFSQLFLTKVERDNLYTETSKLKGSFNVVGRGIGENGEIIPQLKSVKFSDATKQQLEEFHAEGYRAYSIKEGKVVPATTSMKNVFKKIYEFVKNFFKDTTVKDSYSDITEIKPLMDMYKALYNNKIQHFVPSLENTMFTSANAGILSIADINVSRNHTESKLIKDSIDGIISERINKSNSKLTIRGLTLNSNKIQLYKIARAGLLKRYVELLDIKNKTGLELSGDEQKELDSNKNLLTGVITPVSVSTADDIEVLNNKINLLNWTVSNFGTDNDIKDAVENYSPTRVGKGVVGYHMENSTFKDLLKVSIDDDKNINDESASSLAKGDGGYGDYGNNAKDPYENASEQIKYLLSSLIKQDEKGNSVLNDLGFPTLMKFANVSNNLKRKVSGIPELPELHAKMTELSKTDPIYQQLLTKLGDPRINNDEQKTLWLKLVGLTQNPVQHLVSLTLENKTTKDDNHLLTNKLTVKVGQTKATPNKVKNNWLSKFNMDSPKTNPYIELTKGNHNSLNLRNIKRDFLTETTTTKGTDTITSYTLKKGLFNNLQFLRAIGISITPTLETANEVDKFNTTVDILANAIGNLVNRNEQGENKVIIENPIDFFSKKFYTIEKVKDNKGITRERTSSIDGQNAFINKLANIEIFNSDEYSSTSVLNTEGETQDEISKPSTMSKHIHALQVAKNINDFSNPDGQFQYMSYLDRRSNPYAKSSIILQSLFDLNGDRTGNTIDSPNLSGTSLIRDNQGKVDEDGKSHSSMNIEDKFISDFTMALTQGVYQHPTTGGKSTHHATTVSKYITYPGKIQNNLYIDSHEFIADKDGNYPGLDKTVDILIPKIQSELERILMYQKDKSIYNTYKGFSEKTTGDFAIFDGILSKSTKNMLKSKEISDQLKKCLFPIAGTTEQMNVYNSNLDLKLDNILKSSEDLYKIREAISKDLKFYFDKVISEAKEGLMDKYGYVAEPIRETIRKNSGKELDNQTIDDAALRSYEFNTWINNSEIMYLHNGDLSIYNHTKEDGVKRFSGSQSGGIMFPTDEIAQKIVNEKGSPLTFKTTGQNLKFDGTINTGVIKDYTVTREKVYNDLHTFFRATAIKEGFKGDTLTEELYGRKDGKLGTLENPVGGVMKPYMNPTVSDGQGYISLDTYRMFKNLEGDWSKDQEDLYNKIVNGEKLGIDDVHEYFPVYKLQYFGNLKTEPGLLPIQAFHKFALMPLIPGLGLYAHDQLHEQMMKQDMHYITHDSGSKLGSITSNSDENGKPVSDDIFDKEGNYKTDEESKPVQMTKNVIYADYLKNQTKINSQFKGDATYAKQLNILLSSGLIESGVPVDYEKGTNDYDRSQKWDALKEDEKISSSPFYKLVKSYDDTMNKIVELKKEELVNNIAGWKYDKTTKGAIAPTNGSMTSLVDYIKKELEKQGLSKHELSSIELDGMGNLIRDLSGSPIADTIEKGLMNHLDNKIRRQYLTGEPLVEVSAAYTNMKFKKPSTEDITKYGNTGMRYYEPDINGEKSTRACQVKIALQGSFLNLLNLKDQDSNKIAQYNIVDGKQVLDLDKSRLKLNELINNEEWLNVDNNRKKITLTGIRIPVQGLNSMEFAEVGEFLPEQAGNIIILPEEIVSKSGTDFDVDKLTTYMPTISKDGSWLNHNYTNKEDLKKDITSKQQELQELLKTKLGVDGTVKELLKDYRSEKKDKGLSIIALKTKRDSLKSEMSNGIADIQEFIKNKNSLSPVTGGLARLMETNDNNTAKDIIDTFKTKPTLLSGEMSKTFDNLKQNIKELKEIKDALKEGYDDQTNYMQEDPEINKLNNEYQSLKEYKRNFIKSFENSLIDHIKNILELPENAKRLLTPNDTHKVEPFADELQSHVQDFNFQKSKAIDGIDKKTGEGISPTTVLEPTYLLKKHEDIFVSKESLGIGAIANKTNITYNNGNAYIPSTIDFKTKGDVTKMIDGHEITTREDIMKPVPTKLYLNNNKMYIMENGKKTQVISLSKLKDVNNQNEVPEIISQLMNGWVDAEKNAWITYIQGNKEVTPQILFLLQTGASLKDVLYYVSNPIIRDYVQRMKSNMGLLTKLKNPGKDPLFAKSNARRETYGMILKSKKDVDIPNMVNIADRLNTEYGDTPFSTDVLENIAKSKVQDAISNPDAVNGFLHYLYIEELARTFNEPISKTSLDTTKSTTLFDAHKQEAQIEELYQSTKWPRKLISYIVEHGPTSEYNISGLADDLYGKLFKLRNSDSLNNFILDTLKDYGMRGLIKSETGLHPDAFPTKFKNAMMNYIFINELKGFSPKTTKSYKGLSVNYSDSHNQGVEIKNGVIKINESILKKEFDNHDYELDNDSPTSYRSRKLSTLKTSVFYPYESEENLKKGFDEYRHFVVEREYLRSINTISDYSKTHQFNQDYNRLTTGDHASYKIKDSETPEQFKDRVSHNIYEEYLRNKALENSFNLNTMFYNNRQNGIDSYATTLISLINKYSKDGNLKSKYGILQQLSASTYSKEGKIDPLLKNLTNLTLNDAGELTPESIEQYSDDLSKLADPSIKKIEGDSDEIKEDNVRLSELFANFPTYIFLQGGMNKNQFAFPNIFPSNSRMSVIMNNGVNNVKVDHNTLFNLFIDNNRVNNKKLNQRQATTGYRYEMPENLPMENIPGNKVSTTDALKTFDFGSKEGTPQTKEANHKLHENIINNPDKPMVDEGETWDEAVARVFPTIKNILNTSSNNTTVVTHNSIFGLIYLWNKMGRPEVTDKKFRLAYTKQDNQFHTGAHFEITEGDKTIFVVRHGETTDNAKKVFRTSNTQLTDKGIEQATDVGKELSKYQIPGIISSSLPRAIHTSNLIMNEQSNTETSKEITEPTPVKNTQLDLFKDAISKPFEMTDDYRAKINGDIMSLTESGSQRDELLDELSKVDNYEKEGELIDKICKL